MLGLCRLKIHKTLQGIVIPIFFRSKGKAFEMFNYYKKEVGNQLNKKIKVIWSNKAEEHKIPFSELCF